MQTIYRPGQWYLIVIPGALVALPPDVSSDVVTRLWDRLPTTKTLASVVDVLTSSSGGSFTALPPFVAAVAEGTDVRIALRGGVSARVSSGSDDALELSGAEVTTWSERFVAGATRIEITVQETDAVSGLPVQSGIVRAAALSAELEASDAEPIVAVLGPAPVLESEAAGAAAAVPGESPAPALALFGAAAVAGTSVAEPAEALGEGPSTSAGTQPASEPDAWVAEPVEALEEDPSTSSETQPEVEPDVEPDVEPEVEPDVEPDVEVDVEPDAEDEAEVDVELAVAEPVEAQEEDEDLDDDNGIPEHTWEPPEQTLAPASEIDEFEQLFDETLHVGADEPVIPPVPVADLGDHDGATISTAELQALRRERGASDEVATEMLPVVPGAVGRIRVSTGQVVELDRTVIIGRRPRSTRASGDSMPHLIAVESPQQDISRSHLEVRPEAGSVVVIDLHTTNGSTLLRPGADPVRLHPGEQTLVLSDDVVDLGDGVTVAFEGLS